MQLGPFHSHTQSVNLGNLEPLVVYNERSGLPDRKKVSIRWLMGTVLTGLTSVVLMGGALHAALNGQSEVVRATPDGILLASGETQEDAAAIKGDRFERRAAEFVTKRTIPVSVVSRVGDSDYIRSKPYVLVASSLSTQIESSLQGQIPSFNPLKMFADTKAPKERTVTDAIYGERIEGEFSLSQTDFPLNSAEIDPDLTLAEANVELEVRRAALFLADPTLNLAARAIVDPGRFDFDLARQPEFARLTVRVTQENVSFVSRQDIASDVTGRTEKIVPVTEKVEFKDLLLDSEVSDPDAEAVLAAFRHGAGVVDLAVGESLRIAYGADPFDPEIGRAERVSIYDGTRHKATVARADNGIFVAAEAPTEELAAPVAPLVETTSGPVPSVYESIYQTALEQEVPKPLISELVRVLSYDVDFNARVQPGDAMELFYDMDEENGGEAAEILFASLNTGPTQRRLYRFHTSDDGTVDYYDEAGRSAKKFLMRKPMSGGTFRSGFGMRRHPIQGYSKMHTGVDWSAPRGTPIVAAGNGTVIKARWVSGYGKRVEIRHTNGYVTTYNHMNDFGKGVTEGASINQGQVVGYVGSTGLSTGPHLHYEVLVNGTFVDPMRIRLPRGRVLEGEMLAQFEQERDRINTLVGRDDRPSRLASASVTSTR